MKKVLLFILLLFLLPACSADVLINEIMAINDEWVELYNSGDSLVIFNGSITDNFSRDPITNLSIPAKGYALIVDDNIGCSAFNIPEDYCIELKAIGNRLTDAGDSLVLYDDTEEELDTYTWTSKPTTAFARCPDGSDWNTATVPTPGFENNCTVISDDVPEQTDEPKEISIKLEENTFDEKQDLVENKSATLRVAEPILTNMSVQIITEKQENFSNEITGKVIWTSDLNKSIEIAMLIFIAALVTLVIALVLSHKR